MSDLVMEDAREYVFCLFIGSEDKSGVIEESSLKYLGSAFFVTDKGDAITAAHVIPNSEDLQSNQRLFAIAKKDNETVIYRVVMAAVFPDSDLAIFRVEVTGNPFLDVSFEKYHAGTDVMTLGIPAHDIYHQGKELRLFKGHITFAARPEFSELNFAIPSGMSGGPVIVNAKCIGLMSANIRSENLDEQIEEIEEIENTKERITIVESKSILNYGIFIPFSYFHGHKSAIFNGRSLDELIAKRRSS